MIHAAFQRGKARWVENLIDIFWCGAELAFKDRLCFPVAVGAAFRVFLAFERLCRERGIIRRYDWRDGE